MTQAKPISPEQAADLVRAGALLIDIRETSERADGCIPDAQHAPLSSLTADSVASLSGQPVIFHCRSGRRTAMNTEHLCASTQDRDVYLLDGGFDAWAACELPVTQPSQQDT